MRSRTRSRHTPIIFLTADDSHADVAEAYARGAVDIMSKPLNTGKLVERFDVTTYTTLARAMDRHDIGVAWGGRTAALERLADAGTRLTGIGIEDDILYGPRQVHALVDAAREAGVDARTERSDRPRATTRSWSSGTN